MQQKPTAVLFVDISGSTAFFDRYGQVAGHEMVERCFEVVVPEIGRHGGRIVKYMGDGFLAVFGAPRALVEAAAGLYTALATDNESRPEPARVRLHSGGDYGPAVVNEGGDVFGDVVNVAARVQGVAGPDQIYVTADLVKALPPESSMRIRRVGVFPLRGKGAELELHEVMWKFDGATMLFSRSLVREELLVSLFLAGKVVEMPAEQDRLTLGRTGGNDVVVDDGAVSREHAELVRRKGSIYLVDHSTNGTYLRPEIGRPRHLHREECPIDGGGQFSLGRPDGPIVEYKVT